MTPSGQALDLAVVAEVTEAVATVLSERRRRSPGPRGAGTDEHEAAEAEVLIWDELNERARSRTLEKREPLDPADEQRIMERVRANLFGLGGFEPYLADETVEDIFVNVVWDGHVRLHPGRPSQAVMVAALKRMLDHRDPAIAFTKLEWSDIEVPADDQATRIVEAWETADCPAGFAVEARGRSNVLTILTEDWSGDVQGALVLDWTFDPALGDGLVELVVDLSVLLSSPLAVLSHKDAAGGRGGWQSRVGPHRAAVRAATRTGSVFYGLYLGLAGVAHRMVLGDELVAMFGEDRLAALPPELAHRRNGRWVLTPTDDPMEWTYDRWCPGESAIIEALGREHFFDPSTGALPTVVPDLPEVAPYRCRTRDPATGTWTEHNA